MARVLRLTTTTGKRIEIELSPEECEHLCDNLDQVLTASPDTIESWLDKAVETLVGQRALPVTQ